MDYGPYDVCCDECRDPISCIWGDRPEGRCESSRRSIADNTILVYPRAAPKRVKRELILPLVDLAKAAGWTVDEGERGTFFFRPPKVAA